MKTDTEIRLEGMNLLIEQLGPAAASRFLTLVHREGFNYTKWRQNLFEGKTVADILETAKSKENQ
jgi:hypothetical protein